MIGNRRDRFAIGGFFLLSVLLAGCAGGRSTIRSSSPPSGSTAAVRGKATVLAAASLTESFNRIGAQFQRRYPEASVAFNFGSSSTLAAQILEQGGADVFASADQENMQRIAAGGLLAEPARVFARNRLQIVVEKGNPKGVRTLRDLARPGLKVALAAPQVPAGRYAAQALSRAGVTVKPVSLEEDVKAALSKVVLGEADAGIVYVSDVSSAAGKVEGIDIPDAQDVLATYPAGVVRGGSATGTGRAFVLLSPEAQAVLRGNGFLGP